MWSWRRQTDLNNQVAKAREAFLWVVLLSCIWILSRVNIKVKSYLKLCTFFLTLISPLGRFYKRWSIFLGLFSRLVQSVVPGLAVSNRNFLDMQNLDLYPKPTKPETLWINPSNLWFNKPSCWFWHKLKFGDYWSRL